MTNQLALNAYDMPPMRSFNRWHTNVGEGSNSVWAEFMSMLRELPTLEAANENGVPFLLKDISLWGIQVWLSGDGSEFVIDEHGVLEALVQGHVKNDVMHLQVADDLNARVAAFPTLTDESFEPFGDVAYVKSGTGFLRVLYNPKESDRGEGAEFRYRSRTADEFGNCFDQLLFNEVR